MDKKADKRAGETRGLTSLERFVHFQCGYCQGWWGIGDAPERKEWICPWCGKKQSFEDKTPKVMKYR